MTQQFINPVEAIQDEKKKPWLWVWLLPLVAIVCVLIAVFIGRSALETYREWYAVEDYQPTTASITESERVKRRYRSTNGAGEMDQKWDFHVRYQYEVDGVAYVGKRYKLIDTFYRSTTAWFELDKYVEYYKVGSEHTIYFDPENPERSVIKKKVDFLDIKNKTIYPIVFCFLFGFFAFITLFGGFTSLYTCLTGKQPPITAGMILDKVTSLKMSR
ncbi:DUF3592 domain-containing protein [Poriferisphaera sp. WC338]|uniref:DUF3592 domain-containing protein n=1 Tax=Poriferisphaera sp. WC338 TaxID=3425129 RepID=UPI003D817F7E